MFNKLQLSRLLLGTLLLASGLTSCSESTPQDDPAPKQYKVQVRYQASNLKPNGTDVGANVKVLLTDAGQTPKGTIEDFLRDVESGSGQTSEVVMLPTDKISVDLSFPNVTSSFQTKGLPEATSITTEVLLNGQVLRTYKLDKNSSFSGPTLRLQETLKVSDL